MNTEQLKNLIQSDNFHHATYRSLGTLWEGLWIYRKADNLQGFEVVGCFSSTLPKELATAEDVLRNIGSYGNG